MNPRRECVIPDGLRSAILGIGVNPSSEMVSSDIPHGFRLSGPMHQYGIVVSQDGHPVPAVFKQDLGHGAVLLAAVNPSQPVMLTMSHQGPLLGALALTETHKHPLSRLMPEALLAQELIEYEPVGQIVTLTGNDSPVIGAVQLGAPNSDTEMTGILPVRLRDDHRDAPFKSAIHVGAFHEIGSNLWDQADAQALVRRLIAAGSPHTHTEGIQEKFAVSLDMHGWGAEEIIGVERGLFDYFQTHGGTALDTFNRIPFAGVSIVFVDNSRVQEVFTSLRQQQAAGFDFANTRYDVDDTLFSQRGLRNYEAPARTGGVFYPNRSPFDLKFYNLLRDAKFGDGLGIKNRFPEISLEKLLNVFESNQPSLIQRTGSSSGAGNSSHDGGHHQEDRKFTEEELLILATPFKDLTDQQKEALKRDIGLFWAYYVRHMQNIPLWAINSK